MQLLSNPILIGGYIYWFVPEYDEREACKFAGYTWREWSDELDGKEKADTVAWYRMHHLVEAHVNDAITKKMEADSQKRK